MKKSEVHEIIKRIMTATGIKTKAGLAQFLEISPPQINAAITRGRVPDSWLYEVAYKTLYSVEWLRTGRGDKFRVSGEPQPAAIATVGEPVAPYSDAGSFTHRLLAILEELINEDERATLLRCAEALRVGDPEIREHLILQLKIIEEAVKNRRAKRGRGRSAPPGEAAG
jgi:hypothetical protein